MSIDGVSRGFGTNFVDSCARSFECVDEWAHVPYMHFTSIGPARDIIWRSRRGEWLSGRKRLRAHTIYAAEVWDGAMFEDSVLIQVVTVLIVVVRVIALWLT